LVVPLQAPERYFPAAQLMLEQVEHAVLDVPEHPPPLLYLPDPHVAQVEHAVLDVPEHPPLLYLPVPHVAQAEHP